MTMQLIQISLYGHNGERRDVEFELGAVNIITGASKKGKTSLIDIVEYCLGSSECDIAVGCIRDTVAWYSILLQFPDSQAFIARAAPLPGSKSNSTAHMLVEKQVEVPAYSDLSASTNINSIVGFLTSKIGIPEFVTEVPEEQTRSPIKIGFKHSRYYLFQSQYEIADPKLLFHRQGEPHIPQSIKDTMPYFIGAAEDDRLADIEQLRSLKQDRVRLQKKINEIESLKGEGLEKGYGLLAEAADVGLYEGANLVPSEKALLEIFTHISTWKPDDDQPDIGEAEADIDPVLRLENEYRRLSEQKQVVRSRLREAAEYEGSEGGFETAVDQQVARLQSVGIFEKLSAPEQGKCAVCDGEYSGDSRFSQVMHEQLTALDEKLEGVGRSRPRVQSYVSQLKQEQRRLAQEIKRTRESLNAIRRKDGMEVSKSDIDVRRALVVGRISLYMEGITWQEDTSAYKQRLELIEPQIESLTEKLDPELLKEKLDAQLSCIAEDMSEWARKLKLEHSQHRIRLDHKKLTIVAETPHGATPLSTMGSGENWVGYHLVAYMALAKWFIEQGRPVGRFIFFDQPTQAFFPADSADSGDLENIEKDEDRQTVRMIFQWLIEVVTSLAPGLQVIVTDLRILMKIGTKPVYGMKSGGGIVP
ncbi:DUF3732 domain-containing protein [Ketobacter sp.]